MDCRDMDVVSSVKHLYMSEIMCECCNRQIQTQTELMPCGWTKAALKERSQPGRAVLLYLFYIHLSGAHSCSDNPPRLLQKENKPYWAVLSTFNQLLIMLPKFHTLMKNIRSCESSGKS